ncbi:hypothetical protein DPMN_163422 [Dreissena polymorpha]|uniref:Uncharacterized protein n=1 Tax=Dreissena polymorpha TaxID=45954 RepID=A0A9D4ERY9_DREPO|nr:hypothetical protein DPMN_163422 [Dreissena polymorpha]
MQCRCIDNGCRKITDAVNVIEQYEEVLCTHSTFVRALSEESSTHSDTDMRKCLQRIESRLDRLEKVCPRGPPFQNSRHKKPKSPGCFGCKANDHYWREQHLQKQVHKHQQYGTPQSTTAQSHV